MPPSETAAMQKLLHLTEDIEQVDLLKTADLSNGAILEQLLEQAAKLVGSDPGRARELALLCSQLAERTAAPLLIPRAHYICAQTYAAGGDFQNALIYIQQAADGYHRLGDELAALRTNLGRMHVLNEIGRYDEVMQVGQSVLEQLNHHPEAVATTRQIATFTHNNLGICYRRQGRYHEALAAYEAAEKLADGMPVHLGDIHNNRGGILMHLGRANEALAAYEAAADVHAQTSNTWRHAVVLNNIGEAHLHLGNYTRSLAALDEAQRLLPALEAVADEQIGRLYRADVYLALNLYPEAVEAFQAAAGEFEAAGMVHYCAQALWGWGAALIAQSQLTEAASLLAKAVTLFQAAGDVPHQLGVLLEQSALQAAQGQMAQAWQTAQQADLLVDGEKWPVQQLYVHLRLADLQSKTAEYHLQAAQKLAKSLQLPHLQYRLYQRLGHWHWQQGQPKIAKQWLTTAINEIEQLRGTVAQEAMRVSFLHDKIAAYEDLLCVHLEQNDLAQAFVVAEQAKSRTLLDLLTGVLQSPDASLAAADRLQMLQADLNAVYNAFLHRPPAETADLQPRAQQLEREIRQLHLTAKAVPSELRTKLFSWDNLHLAADNTLLAYHVVGTEVMVFVVEDGRLQVQRHLCTIQEVQDLQQRLAVQWQRFHIGVAFTLRHQGTLERSAQRVLQELHDALLAPIISLLAPSSAAAPRTLTVIPHGLLHQIPFHALHDGQAYVLDSWVVHYAPSVQAWSLCQQKAASAGQNALIMGVSDPLIPAVAQEVALVAETLAQTTVYIDDAATVATFKTQAAQYDVLHLTCHGLFRTDNPMFSSLQFGDGWLTAVDILNLKLPNSLVTLSACESGRGQTLTGDEVMGLTRAFLAAGAATVVVSLWLVQDEAAAGLMADLYGRYQYDDSRAGALRQAQLALKARHPHPYFWAPFVLVGNAN